MVGTGGGSKRHVGYSMCVVTAVPCASSTSPLCVESPPRTYSMCSRNEMPTHFHNATTRMHLVFNPSSLSLSCRDLVRGNCFALQYQCQAFHQDLVRSTSASRHCARDAIKICTHWRIDEATYGIKRNNVCVQRYCKLNAFTTMSNSPTFTCASSSTSIFPSLSAVRLSFQ